jgi:hypothetical protein
VAAAKARGVQFGQPSKIVGKKRDAILKDIWALELTMDQIAAKYGLKSKTTLNNHFPGERAKALEAAGIRNRPQNGRKK